MHQSGHSRAHSMQTVQFSSFRAITPRARGARSSFSWGYWTVTAPLVQVLIMVLNVTPRPLARPGSSGIADSSGAIEADHTNTLKAAVAMMLRRERGMRTFQAKA